MNRDNRKQITGFGTRLRELVDEMRALADDLEERAYAMEDYFPTKAEEMEEQNIEYAEVVDSLEMALDDLENVGA